MTQLTSSADPATVGQDIVFTAVVTSTASGTPTGNVTFTVDGQAEPPVALAVVNGVDEATFSTTSLGVGPHTIGAAYGGDTAFASSSVTTTLDQTVSAPPLQATTTKLTSSADPATAGQAVTFTATVAAGSGAGTPTGTVTFTIDGRAAPPVALAVVNGVDEATLSTASLDVGQYTIGAAYGGDTAFASSSVATPLDQTVSAPALLATAMQLTSSANPATFGQPVTFTAVVTSTTSGTPTGNVTFTVDGQAKPPAALAVVNGVDEATFSTTSLGVGPHTIGAAYGGDTAFASSSVTTTLDQTVSAPPLQALSSSLGISPTSPTAGQVVTLTDVVKGLAAGTPIGTVVFTIDGQAQRADRALRGRWPGSGHLHHLGPDRRQSRVLRGLQRRRSVRPEPVKRGDAGRVSGHYGVTAIALRRTPASATTSAPAAPVPTDGPKVVSMLRYGYHMMPTRIVLAFDQVLDAVTAEDAKDYRIIGPGGQPSPSGRRCTTPRTGR